MKFGECAGESRYWRPKYNIPDFLGSMAMKVSTNVHERVIKDGKSCNWHQIIKYLKEQRSFENVSKFNYLYSLCLIDTVLIVSNIECVS